MISVIIQGRGDVLENLKRSISCFLKQTYKEKELILIIDQIFSQQLYEDRLHNVFWGIVPNSIRIYSNINAEFIHNNVSSMRNFWAQQAKWDYILFMDDDEDIPENYLDKNIEYRKKYRKILKKDFVLTPTLMYRHTGVIQNQGFTHFNYWLSRPIGCVLGQREWAEIQMYSWNSLFAPAVIFQINKMDESFDFVYEDLAYSYGLHASGIPIIVTKDIEICHMERDKTKLEQAWVGNIYQAHRKAKHRMLFVHKFGTVRQKIQFFLLWFRWQPLRLTIKVLFWKTNKKKSIINHIWKGTLDGIRG